MSKKFTALRARMTAESRSRAEVMANEMMGEGTMKLHVLSDLHIEFSAFKPPATNADVILLSGDIGEATAGIRWAQKNWPAKPVVYVPGNHEFYGCEREKALRDMRAAAQDSQVHLLDNNEVIVGGVRFLGCTLWTDFLLLGEDARDVAMFNGAMSLNDFRVIREDGQARFTPGQSIKLHDESLMWLKNKLDEPFAGKTIVVTHHLPSKLSVVDRFKSSLLSACFASDLGDLFGRMDLWVHGHTHDSLDYEVNGTRVICNPRGYVFDGVAENPEFDPGLIIEI